MWLGGRGCRQYPHVWGCCTDLFLEQRFMCVVLTWPEGSPSMRNLVPLKTSTMQHGVQLGSSPLNGSHQHKWPLHLEGRQALLGLGSVPQLALWRNKASEGLARFHVPRECCPDGILTLHCVSFGGACGEMRVLRCSKGQNKSFC